MQQRPSRSPFLIALVASAIWFVLGLLVSWAVFQKTFDASGSTAEMLANPAIAAVIATVVIPIALFWFLAILVWRAQELRLMSSAMTEVAVRLAEPDRMAEQSVASLGPDRPPPGCGHERRHLARARPGRGAGSARP